MFNSIEKENEPRDLIKQLNSNFKYYKYDDLEIGINGVSSRCHFIFKLIAELDKKKISI
jgi:hypothetical protein